MCVTGVETNWLAGFNNDCELGRYLVIHPQYKVCRFWLFMKQYPYMKCQCFYATKFLCEMFTKRYYIICKKCKIATDELCIHLFSPLSSNRNAH